MKSIINNNFDVNIAEQHLNKLLKQYKIKVIKWSKSSCGYAYYDTKEIKIPKPIDIDRFCVAMHEIKHIIDGKFGKLFEREFACEIFAINEAIKLGFNPSQYKERARRYVIMNIAKGYCRKLDLNKISQEIKDFCNIDFELWKNKKVFVSNWGSKAIYNNVPLNIIYENK